MTNKRIRGNSLIEFALGFAVFWAFFAGTFMFGYTMQVYNLLETAVGMGARYASHVEFDEPDHTFITKVKNMVVYGSDEGGASPLVPGLTTDQVSVTWTKDSGGVPQTLTVSVQNYTVNAVFRSFTFNKPSVTVKVEGVYKS